ncbi:peptide chain release factor 1 [Coprinopsis cinerea okayama7|uniref:Peptide chain release factor 1 n=1 Tax=Coprinopsis cinerea (strain Okayama-7 / 130 / ATCC MYA-4618 / FGSC 9003) TaxID=240176 RepID=A8NMZ0_COPC7|nr:peptide chain release factor 1 [Coprinopsis cinerea okayama7\|eukprot:XP_001835016.2 peptide chain release factor 1 [Coprinopsis cinerea okayama7\
MSLISEDMSDKDDVSRLKQVKESEPLQEAWDQWKETRKLLDETNALLSDPDPSMRAMASEESTALNSTLQTLVESTFPSLLLPPSPTAQLSALLELKSGVGGSESSLFAGDLLRMYQRLAVQRGWKAEIAAKNDTDDGGVKDVIMEIKGVGAYDALRWESGVHRVQRVPATESKGRVHTSAVAVLVLPLVEENDTHGEDLFKMEDVKIEVMRARGAGGQHVNRTESAVRLTHIPSGITVSMQDERSQHQNRRRAFQVLRSRLLDQKIHREMAERRATRRNLVSGSDRSDKIRTYNFPQERVTDHRIGLTLTNLSSVLEGEGLEDFIDAIQKHQNETAMEEMMDID